MTKLRCDHLQENAKRFFLLSVYVRAAEKDLKRKLAIANWDCENVVDLTNCEDGPDADGKADDFYATDNDDLYDSNSDELADSAESVLCFKPSSNQSRLARHTHRWVITLLKSKGRWLFATGI
ncbi:hypothetical protein L1987_49230 [Smallanthus sonchifolius]|uniref:Uncharacterized protein n=1 Tax=Smallanthus sonchifolius TaxID=185202 RepID=A0ACB9FV81_9ASTR|nr:hypothetical protein L1987_49230 [Smallanthus sonchifolius]